MSYLSRLLTLLLIFVAVALLELKLRGARATRWREYGFIVISGALGACCGMAIDQLSLSLSADYFILGKGLEDGSGLRWRVTALGSRAGFFAGIVTGMLLLLFNKPRTERPALALRRLFSLLPWPLLGALLIAPAGAGLFASRDPLGQRSALIEALPGPRADAFLLVWGLHCGLYLGAILGLIWSLGRLRRERAATAKRS